MLILGTAALPCSCSTYQVTLNNRSVYQPPALLRAIAVADPALETCIEQTIVDQAVVDIKDLVDLRCTHTGIVSLTGLEQLTHLAQLDLSNNLLTAISSLLNIESLILINLLGNPELVCDQVERIKAAKPAVTIRVPKHCHQN